MPNTDESDLIFCNEEIREMARAALQCWLFDEDTDPDGNIKRGLKHLTNHGDWDQDIIAARFKGRDDWDDLQEWANFLGQR